MQLRLDARPITIVPAGVKLWALAWLQFGDVDVQAVVQVMRWTADAVGVQLDVDGETLRCWLWQGACQRLENRTDAWCPISRELSVGETEHPRKGG